MMHRLAAGSLPPGANGVSGFWWLVQCGLS